MQFIQQQLYELSQIQIILLQSMTQANPQVNGSKSRLQKGSFKLQQDPHSIMINALNSSSSKMQYSFPKSERFNLRQKSKSPDVFYNIPDTKSKRGTSFGYGSKMDFSKSDKYAPDPTNYNIQGSFEKDSSNKGITFGAGRQIVKANSVFSLNNTKNPGPGNYNPKLYNLSHSFALKSRIQDNSDKWKRSTPAPGSYGAIELINKDCKTPLVSKYGSCCTARFGSDKRRSMASSEAVKIPSVGTYQLSEKINSTSKYYMKRGNHFSKGQRQGLTDRKLEVPGPGAYGSFSEFLH